MTRVLMLAFVLVACSDRSDAPDERTLVRTELAAQLTPTWQVHFSPKGGCQDQIVAFIATAKTSVRLAAYGFTSQPIAQALITAKAKGKDVAVVLDRSDVGPSANPHSQAELLKAAGIAVWIDKQHAIMHDKFIVIDNQRLETGSYNFTAQAETSNAENCLELHQTAVAQAYQANWITHQAHSEAY